MGLLSTSVVILVALVCSVVSSNSIQDHSIYKISNKDGGVLTLDGSGDSNDMKVKISTWNDAGGQKWKAKLPLLSKSFEFKPTSNDKARLDADELSSKIFGRKSSEDTKYWYVKDMAEGVFQIKNYKTGTCISSQGLNKNAKLAACDNSSAQQWIFTQL